MTADSAGVAGEQLELEVTRIYTIAHDDVLLPFSELAKKYRFDADSAAIINLVIQATPA